MKGIKGMKGIEGMKAIKAMKMQSKIKASDGAEACPIAKIPSRPSAKIPAMKGAAA